MNYWSSFGERSLTERLPSITIEICSFSKERERKGKEALKIKKDKLVRYDTIATTTATFYLKYMTQLALTVLHLTARIQNGNIKLFVKFFWWRMNITRSKKIKNANRLKEGCSFFIIFLHSKIKYSCNMNQESKERTSHSLSVCSLDFYFLTPRNCYASSMEFDKQSLKLTNNLMLPSKPFS